MCIKGGYDGVGNIYSWISKSTWNLTFQLENIRSRSTVQSLSSGLSCSLFWQLKVITLKWLKSHKLELLWSKGNEVLNPSVSAQVVFYLELCKQNMVVLNACQWKFNGNSCSIQITVIMVVELDYPLKKSKLQIMLWWIWLATYVILFVCLFPLLEEGI